MKFQAYISKIRSFLSFKLFTALIYCLLALVLLLILYHNMKPETYDMEKFQVADKTIRSPKTIEDEMKTAEEREKAAEAVDKVYVFKKEMAQNRVSLLTSIFDFVTETNHDSDQELKEKDKKETEKTKEVAIEERLKVLKSKLTENVSEDITDSISDTILLSLLQAKETDLQTTKNVVIQYVESAMTEEIREDGLNDAKKLVQRQIRAAGLPESLVKAGEELGQYAIVPTELYDPELTEERKKQAMAEVEPVKILQGQIVVQEGHLIDRDTYRQLELLGLLKSNPTIKPLVGLVLFVILVIGSVYIYFSRVDLPEEKKQNYLLLSKFYLHLFLSSDEDCRPYRC